MIDEDLHSPCSNCRGKSCNADDRCSDWTDENWEKVSVYPKS